MNTYTVKNLRCLFSQGTCKIFDRPALCESIQFSSCSSSLPFGTQFDLGGGTDIVWNSALHAGKDQIRNYGYLRKIGLFPYQPPFWTTVGGGKHAPLSVVHLSRKKHPLRKFKFPDPIFFWCVKKCTALCQTHSWLKFSDVLERAFAQMYKNTWPPHPPCGEIRLIGKGIPVDDILAIVHKRLHACNNVIPGKMKSSLKSLGDELNLRLWSHLML